MRIKYNRDQKIKGNLTRNFDKDYAFLEKALDRSGDIVKNVFYVGDTADIQSIMEDYQILKTIQNSIAKNG